MEKIVETALGVDQVIQLVLFLTDPKLLLVLIDIVERMEKIADS